MSDDGLKEGLKVAEGLERIAGVLKEGLKVAGESGGDITPEIYKLTSMHVPPKPLDKWQRSTFT